MKGVWTGVALLAAVSLAGIRGWERWGPVPETPEPPSAEVAQWDDRTCGPASVATLLNVYHRSWNRQSLELECRVGPKGASMFDLLEACRKHGLEAEGVRATGPEGLKRVPRPFIAHLREGHFVVVRDWIGGTFGIFDPTRGRSVWWTPEELYRRSGGWSLSAHP